VSSFYLVAEQMLMVAEHILMMAGSGQAFIIMLIADTFNSSQRLPFIVSASDSS
jgi:hypothetical protein